mgnify:CR=1 FL=1
MESHCLSAEEDKIEHSEMKGIERSEMIDNRAKLHGLMRNAMKRVSVPIKKGEGCATLFTFDDDR